MNLEEGKIYHLCWATEVFFKNLSFCQVAKDP